jgi:CopA family copper-resistance protein
MRFTAMFAAICLAILTGSPSRPAVAGPAGGGEYSLTIERAPVRITGRERVATTINGTIPGPTLRWREGETVTVKVTNRLDEPTSIHWHGLLVPASMDGVPELSFDGIPPGETYTYRFTLQQSGTYWYHSHSALQEQSGVYAPLIIEPARKEAYRYDRDHVVLLSDWTDENPHRVMARLKKQSDYYNFQRRTAVDFFRDVAGKGWRATVADRAAWGRMRMDATDIADVTGYTYTFLVNGQAPATNWTALFAPGERVRLRFINASAMTYFDVRIPGLKLEVVQADGQDVVPVVVDEFRIAVAETYDVIVEPREDRAYTIYAESMDRSGYARGTLAPRAGMSAPIPEPRSRPLRTMADMGMEHGTMDHRTTDHGPTGGAQPDTHADRGAMPHGTMDHRAMDHGPTGGTRPDTPASGGAMHHGTMPHGTMGHRTTDHGPTGSTRPDTPASGGAMHHHGPMDHGTTGGQRDTPADSGAMHDHGAMGGADGRKPARPEATPEGGEPAAVHGPDRHGPGNSMVAMMPRSRLHEPGTGLGEMGRRVLVYTDLRSLEPYERRKPEREIELHLTGNMERYIWGFDGKKFSQARPIELRHGERVRVTLVNDTMMEHPIHLHGMWMELDNGHGDRAPRKHTIDVKPGERLSFDVTADAAGAWAFHCHLLYHMEAGMFRTVIVSEAGAR